MEIEDKAQRLHSLIERLQECAANTTMVNKMATSTVGNVHALNDLPLWQTLSRIAEEIRLEDDRALRDAFLSLCTSVLTDIQSIPIRKESVRITWLSRVTAVSRVFDADNFGLLTREAFAKHFTSSNLEALDSISERFRSAGVKESTEDELDDALSAVRDAVKAMSSSGELDDRIARVLGHHLQQMETVYSQASDFGDEMFWKVYKETFATFVQIHPVIADLENAQEVKGKLQTVMEKLTSKTIAGVSLGANLATLATAFYPLIGGAP
ncbi:hypothetical protein [Agrobacterium cavarae]|uniref:hypothetical protein n=1 Tax=Agrobacterium cavarae TaxID=2528239 RepID=UPI0013A70B28